MGGDDARIAVQNRTIAGFRFRRAAGLMVSNCVEEEGAVGVFGHERGMLLD